MIAGSREQGADFDYAQSKGSRGKRIRKPLLVSAIS
jgi:hypothetical protein